MFCCLPFYNYATFFSKVHPTKFLPKKKELNLIRERVARRIQGKVTVIKNNIII